MNRLYVLMSLGVFAVTAVLGFIGLPVLERLNVGQHERSFGPASHLKKSGTPTFGGVLFIVPITLAVIIGAARRPGGGMWPVLLLSLGMALVGFADDYVKVRVNRRGLSEKQKSVAVLVVAALFLLWYLFLQGEEPFLLVPFTGHRIIIRGFGKFLYFFFALFYFYACVNAVNLTDGVDGLCVSVTGVAALFAAAAAVTISRGVGGSLRDLYEGQGLLAVILLGGCVGFFVHNRHVARVFMGDTGSLMLGAMLSGIMFMQGFPWGFLLSGIIYVAEIGSVLIQRTYYRHTGGKRIFLMSPIHHHYELKGWSEWKIVGVFTAITALGSLLTYLMVTV